MITSPPQQWTTPAEVQLLAVLIRMVEQTCNPPAFGELNSQALSAFANAMRTLAAYGLLTITDEYFRAVSATWNPRRLQELNDAYRALQSSPLPPDTFTVAVEALTTNCDPED